MRVPPRSTSTDTLLPYTSLFRSSLGANILQIRPGQGFGRGGGGPRPPAFKMADVNAIAQQIAGVKAVAPQTQSSVVAVRNAANWTTTVNGTNSDYFTAQRWDLKSEEHTSELRTLMRTSYSVFCS